MLFTRTIRRKMVFGLALVLVMLVTLSLGGISGLLSYRSAIADLDYSINQVPQRSELVEAIAGLFEPLLLNVPDSRGGAQRQQRQFQKRLDETRGAVQEFQRKLDLLPPTPANIRRRPITEAFLASVVLQLEELQRLQTGLGDPRTRAETAATMRQEVAGLLVRVQGVPLHQEGLNATLQQASRVYRSRLSLIGWTTAVVVILFAGLLRYGYVGIFAPLRKLHQGAVRVAHGDFDYRLKLDGHDEMAELAAAFNEMTARFQEIARDLDGKVRERSRQLVRSERLAGVGFLAAGVAHEINNPLQAIMVAAESLESRADDYLRQADPADADVVRQYLGMVRRESQRCKEITARLLDFSRGQDTTRSRTDLAAVVSEVLALVGHLSKFRDRRILFEPHGPCWIEVNGPEIKQVVLNLVSNALESMESGGTLNIDIAEQTDHVHVAFTDDGCGMTPDVLENLFEPFFTQRKDGKGTGLGMSISHRIVSDHGGTIEAFSDGPRTGSTIQVHLPRRAAARDAA